MSSVQNVYQSLSKASSRLEEALEESLAQPENELYQDAVIQRFEFTFELCWKLMKSALEDQFVELKIGGVKTVLRESGRKKLIDDVEAWINFAKERNLTSHTYKEEVADEVFAAVKNFPPYVRDLLAKVKQIQEL